MRTKSSARPRLQKGTVVDRAMELADSEGLDAVTIRRLAQELGVTPMALYWHFSDKDALLAAVSERLWDDVATELIGSVDDQSWEYLRVVTSRLVAVLRRHPGCAPLAPLAVLSSPSGLAITERALEVLAVLGIDGQRGCELAHFLLATSITLVASRPGGDVCVDDMEDRMRAKKVALAALPPDRYPRVAAMASYLVESSDVEGYFDHGIDFVLGGVRQQVQGTL